MIFHKIALEKIIKILLLLWNAPMTNALHLQLCIHYPPWDHIHIHNHDTDNLLRMLVSKQQKAFFSFLLKTESASTQPCNGCLCTLFTFASFNQWMSSSWMFASKRKNWPINKTLDDNTFCAFLLALLFRKKAIYSINVCIYLYNDIDNAMARFMD